MMINDNLSTGPFMEVDEQMASNCVPPRESFICRERLDLDSAKDVFISCPLLGKLLGIRIDVRG